MKKLQDKVALVTGASRGIGRAIAIKLAAAGAKVAVNYARSEKEALEVVAEIEAAGGVAMAIKASVGSSDEVKAMFEAVEKTLGVPDILVNNAGITKDNLLIRMNDDDFDAVIDTNLNGAFYCMRAAAKGMMKKRYGKIINISSVVGFSGNAGQVNYVASKAGLHGMTKTVAAEMGGRGIRVNSVAPGFIKSEMTDSLSDDIKNGILNQTLLKSLGTVDDIAAAVYFLASPDSDYVTGQVLHVNGGMYL
ncbi:MAG: 3-oxoacyl-[acyl-carrier-protein] reductase [Deferribacteraceae bacterium]|jgi:3-oxoacyl-[acyl-carrier protein] reductase|nr:3-oxoacyl-[acyl-carrier-protein] reductase [Deferribacteraceae bacterium]